MGNLRGLERNLKLIPVLYAGQGAIFWIPTFVLYFSQTFSPAQILLLEAVYYTAIVGLEVPSGWLSDRVGRRYTLVASGLGWTLGAVAMGLGGSVVVFAVAQILLAVGRSFASGTDSSLLYETLSALDREEDYREHHARAGSFGFGMLAVGSLIGGAVGMVSLTLPYALSAVGGCVATGTALLLTEPAHSEADSQGWRAQARALKTALGVREVRWVFLAVVAFTVFSHIPYELQQPWLEGVVGGTNTPMVSGVLVAVAMGGASLGSAMSSKLASGLGVKPSLLLAIGLVALVMGGMAAGPYGVVIPLLLVRSVPTGLVGPLAASLVHPHLDSSIRATYLSTQSLVGRLAFAFTLLLASTLVGDEWSLTTLRAVLIPATVACLVTVLVLFGLPLHRRDG